MVNDASSSHFFIFLFFLNSLIFHFSCRSFLLVAPSSSALLPLPRPSFLLIGPSCYRDGRMLNTILIRLTTISFHSESVKIVSILSTSTKALPTNRRTNQRTDGQSLLQRWDSKLHFNHTKHYSFHSESVNIIITLTLKKNINDQPTDHPMDQPTNRPTKVLLQIYNKELSNNVV